ncbi:MAG: class I SAM-dependent methyltransferase [Promethearchaeota archaeon]|nr:MAG: class I SAM-dependent methyltransferase [Candidatus Lokiarchaeota archaeon]
MDLKKVTSMNRDAWNEAMEYHRKAKKQEYLVKFTEPTFIQLHPVEQDVFHALQLPGKRVAHVCCNNGIELISLTRLGAHQCVGFDITDAAIQDAREYNTIAGTDCTFIQTDVYDLNPLASEWYQQFDFVYISVGALCWLPDLKELFQVCAALLKEEGHLVMFEGHPYVNMFAFPGEEGFDSGHPLNPVYSYFRKEEFVFTDGIDYVGGEIYESKPHVNFSHTMGEILNGMIANHLCLTQMQEYPLDITTIFPEFEKGQKVPLSVLIVGQKITPPLRS